MHPHVFVFFNARPAVPKTPIQTQWPLHPPALHGPSFNAPRPVWLCQLPRSVGHVLAHPLLGPHILLVTALLPCCPLLPCITITITMYPIYFQDVSCTANKRPREGSEQTREGSIQPSEGNWLPFQGVYPCTTWGQFYVGGTVG